MMDKKIDTLSPEFRKTGIGGSDAGAILGYSPYKTNVQLWEEKTGRREPFNLSNNKYVAKGKAMEPVLIQMFQLTHPQYEIHGEYTARSEQYPFMFATLDGTISTMSGMGILEIKTAAVKNLKGWAGKVPQTYYCQILHYLATTGFPYAILYAYLEIELGAEGKDCESQEKVGYLKEYRFNRNEKEIQYLVDAEWEFWQCVKEDRKPNLIMRG